MITLASVIERFEADYLAQYGATSRLCHTKALAAMKRCRTQLAPRMLAQCGACGEQRVVPHSCGHRNCPHCQHHESQQWIERQLQRQVPASYFMLTFTVPAELRELAWQHQSWFYARLFDCAWETVNDFSHNDKKLQGKPGAVAVLHTHSRRLDYHPHVHLVMPAAALDAQINLWRTKCAKASNGLRQDKRYLFNHKALAKVFRAKLLAAIRQEGLVLPARLPEKWVVDCKCVGSGEKALVYLGRYLYRGVIQEKDILRCEDGQVSFRYVDAKSGKMQVRTLSGAAFLWLLLQHVLPKGFRRARNFGFLHPNSKRLIALLHLALRIVASPVQAWVKPRATLRCPCCGEAMQIVRRRICPSAPGREPDEALSGVAML
ncbi:IS91 family transposase [Rhodoferax antarcticus]|uniref:Transposase family protein n=2 Tax=Rhodoferax antarcticus TaxID=81479 RepID=A0A1Q8Y9R4_9BURK|nr:transposase [Rhodoferax antarcticus]APW46917.1 IS91 family transposase [Rhodoferax antarcticus]APW47307.1 IS91 family transposase [Rhodoferax antarcticus]OLP04755.1 transposase family protein [Rhodoferax antarcticus ANT.BR]